MKNEGAFAREKLAKQQFASLQLDAANSEDLIEKARRAWEQVCCSVLQCVAVCCSVLQCVYNLCGRCRESVAGVVAGVLQFVLTCCSMLQLVAACCSLSQCV